MLRIADHAYMTDVGRQRHTNEDAYYDEPPLFAVADGMGGAQAGEVASGMAIEEFIQERDDSAPPERQLEQIAKAANRKIFERAQADSRHAGMGTTLTAVMVNDQSVAVGHVGDSRLYLYRDGRLERMTRDHSLVEEFVRQGRLTPEQAEKHPQRSVITRALGPESDVEVDQFTIPARDGDGFLICSDGLSGMVSDSDMESIIGAGDPLEKTAGALVEAANQNGGRDNITAVLFRLEEDGSGRPASAADTESYETIAGDQQAPSSDQIEAERQRIADMDTQARAREAQGPSRASPRMRPPDHGTRTTPRPRPAPRRRGRWLPRAMLAAVLILGIVAAAVYGVSRNVYFVGTNDQGIITLYRGLPYELPLGLELYSQRHVSGIPALSLTAKRRDRVLDHQLRSEGDARDLVDSLGIKDED